jgi:general stress protein 26
MHVAHLDSRFSSPDAAPVDWETVRQHLADGDLYWVVTVRGDGRPHVTPLLAVVLDDVLHFCTGPTEQKAKNLAANPHCSLLTGNSSRLEGLDVVVEGSAVRVTDEALLRRLADEWVRKYGEDWRFDVVGSAFVHAADSLRGDDPGSAHVFAVDPRSVFAFGKGEPYSQTRFTFPGRGASGGATPEGSEHA